MVVIFILYTVIMRFPTKLTTRWAKLFMVCHFAAPQEEIIFLPPSFTLKKVRLLVCSFIKILYIGIHELRRLMLISLTHPSSQ